MRLGTALSFGSLALGALVPAASSMPRPAALPRPVPVSDPAPETPRDRDPVDVVWATLLGFCRRSPSAYVRWMTDDFVFTSDDSDFRARFPRGISREDERVFAQHLFEGGGRGPRGEPLPVAVGVALDTGPLLVDESQTTVTLAHGRVIVPLSDGGVLDFGQTRSTFELTLTEGGWRLRRWTETLGARPLTTVLPPDPSREVRQPLVADPRMLRLSLSARPSPDRAAIELDVALPRAGAVIETYDTMGRRISRTDLSSLPAGLHRLTLDAAEYPSGVYWARLRQGAETATRKIVWVR